MLVAFCGNSAKKAWIKQKFLTLPLIVMQPRLFSCLLPLFQEEKTNDKSLLLFEVTLSEAYHTSLEKERKTSSCNNSTSPTCGQKNGFDEAKNFSWRSVKRTALSTLGLRLNLGTKLKCCGLYKTNLNWKRE